MKPIKKPRFKESTYLVERWLANELPHGGYYEGSSSHIEVSNDRLYAGYNNAILIGVLVRPLRIALGRSATGNAFCGEVSRAVSYLMECNRSRETYHLIPAELRVLNKTHPWKTKRYEAQTHLATDYTPFRVDRLRDEFSLADVETLTPYIHERVERAIVQFERGRKEGNNWGVCEGIRSRKWDPVRMEPAEHARYYATGGEPFHVLKETFLEARIPWKTEWDNRVAVKKAKYRLSEQS